jgi:TRAP-type C4-dicarboxylate transport system permease small subunit
MDEYPIEPKISKETGVGAKSSILSLINAGLKVSKWTNVVAEVALTFMMFLTGLDVIMRAFGRPIPGTYELVAFSGAVLVGFSAPLTERMKGHVSVDLVTEKLSRKTRDIVNGCTRCVIMALFIMIGWRLIVYGMTLHNSNEVSMTLQLPFYVVAYGLAMCCFIHSFVSFCDILRIVGGTYE